MNLIITAIRLKNDIVEKKLTIYAAQAAFFLLLSIIPFLMSFLNLLQFFSPHSIDRICKLLLQYTSADLTPTMEYILNEIYIQSSGAFISAALVGAIWSSSKCIYAIERGLNEIYDVEKNHGFIKARLISFLYMILFLAVLLITIVVLVLGSSIRALLKNWFPPLFHIVNLFLRFRLLVIVPMLILFFMCLYTFYPGRKLSFKKQLPGAAFTAIAWILFSIGYEFYIHNITNYSRIYGSMGAVLLMLLWIYFCMNLILFGAEINYFFST